jgi:hypothetical protein
MDDEALAAIRSDLDSLAERLGDAAYDSLRAQLRGSGKPTKTDPDLVRERLLSRARNAVERASSLVAQAERVGAPDDVSSEAEDAEADDL